MQSRGKVINRLALVLLSIVVLELVLIGDQVQPVKAIKKKIFLKKLKKIIPLMALIKPKKKIILLPIPIPMFKNQGHRYPPHQGSFEPMGMEGGVYAPGRPMAPPMSFMMMTGEPMGAADPTSAPMSYDSAPTLVGANSSGAADSGVSSSSPAAMMMPSMTMTIQSEPGGGSAIELSTNMMGANSSSLPLVRPHEANGLKWSSQHQQHQLDQFDDAGFNADDYYSSPWATRAPLASPAKLLRGERFRSLGHQQQAPVVHRPPPTQPPATSTTRPALHQQTFTLMSPPARTQATPTTSGRLQQRAQQPTPPVPMLVIKNQWRPAQSSAQPQLATGQQLGPQQSGAQHRDRHQLEQLHQFQHQLNQALDYEDLVPVGPPQVMPIYLTPNGQLHLSPPPPLPSGQPRLPASDSAALQAPTTSRRPLESSGEQEDSSAGRGAVDLNAEVQTLGLNPGNDSGLDNLQRPTSGRTTNSQQQSGRLASPSTKGKQLQASSGGKRRQPANSGYYMDMPMDSYDMPMNSGYATSGAGHSASGGQSYSQESTGVGGGGGGGGGY